MVDDLTVAIAGKQITNTYLLVEREKLKNDSIHDCIQTVVGNAVLCILCIPPGNCLCGETRGGALEVLTCPSSKSIELIVFILRILQDISYSSLGEDTHHPVLADHKQQEQLRCKQRPT